MLSIQTSVYPVNQLMAVGRTCSWISIHTPIYTSISIQIINGGRLLEFNEPATESKLVLFKTFIRKHINSCSLLWVCGSWVRRPKGDGKGSIQRLYVFYAFRGLYTGLRYRAERPLLYTKRLVLLLLRKRLQYVPVYNRGIYTKYATPYNVVNCKLEILLLFRKEGNGKYTLCYEAAKLWNI